MIKILKPGFYTTVQDLGRFGYQQYGIPVSGAMDLHSAKLANQLLGNNENSAVLEITMIGPKLQFNMATNICISGADLSPQINEKRIKLNKATSIEKGDIVSFGSPVQGMRSYLAIAGGIQSNLVMDSKSMYQNITEIFVLKTGDSLVAKSLSEAHTSTFSAIKWDDQLISRKIMEAYQGPEFSKLSEQQQMQLLNAEFTVSKYNNRMAYQLEEPLENSLEQIITSLVMPGTVQLTPSGQLIALMRDCQTTGGYPRVLQLSEDSINCLAQKRAGDVLTFKLI